MKRGGAWPFIPESRVVVLLRAQLSEVVVTIEATETRLVNIPQLGLATPCF